MNDLFKNQVVLELEKDKAWYNAQQFRTVIEKEYGFVPSTEVYLKIVNYQIEKYGTSLQARSGNTPKGMSRKKRKSNSERSMRAYEERKVIERAEKNERKNMVHTRKTS